MTTLELSRAQVLAHRVHAQRLGAARSTRSTTAPVLDLGVQDTGPDGARWALELRGSRPAAEALLGAWTLRGAPHLYRRDQADAVALAVAPWSERDAAKRVFDAAKPLREAGIAVLDALDAIATEMRDVAASPVPKGEMSTELTRRIPPPYVRWCNPCRTHHLYEQTFRLSALRAGLELVPGTSPPVLRRIPGWRGPATRAVPALDPVRGVLHLLGPATPKQVSEYVDAPVADVKDHWPEDAVPVRVDGEDSWALEGDLDSLRHSADVSGVVRLLGPFDLFLQGRDRHVVVPDGTSRQDLWRTIGRPGGILVGHEVVGSWRPRASGRRLRVAVRAWGPTLPDLTEQAERLAQHRGLRFEGFASS